MLAKLLEPSIPLCRGKVAVMGMLTQLAPKIGGKIDEDFLAGNCN
jgi:hypothetical protein